MGFAEMRSLFLHCKSLFVFVKRGAKLQQARLIGASDDVNKRRGALAPAGVGGGFKPTTDGRMEPAA